MLKLSKISKTISAFIILVLMTAIMQNVMIVYAATSNLEVNLTSLKYTVNGIENSIKNYTQDDYVEFVADFNNNDLPEIYSTEFLYDGVDMVKTPDLDDFVEANSNDTKIETLSIKAININTTGNIKLSGEITGGMIAVNTNNISDDINLILNDVNIDTDNKKVPAIYVYNKNINYTEHKVTIKTVSGTKNYLEGGKFKKVSKGGSDELSNYSSYYSGTAKTNYDTYTNYYAIYTKEQINNILFAKVQAESEDLADGDPYYFYKGTGAISSDIDLYFEGEGYLSVISKNKEGIETKGNLTFSKGTGDYYIFAEDDCLNTTTSSQGNNNVRNTLTINVNSLIAIVDPETNEGDSIDSNGTLEINGGTIIAFSHPTSQDDGLDSEKGTYINGGTVVAIGNMSDRIEDSSTQDFIKLNFLSQQEAETLICITDTNKNPILAFKSDRTFTTLTLSSPNLTKQTYYIYKGGTIKGTENNGLYTKIDSYTLGTQQQWTGGGNQMGGNQMPGDNNNDRNPLPPDGVNNGEQEEMTPPDENIQNGENPPQKPEGENGDNRPDMPSNQNGQNSINAETSIEFTLSSQSHTFNNVTNYTGTSRNKQ